ncbi:hypothetical protein QQS21_008444 [Conoideocrella luteorostrata]|uniref:Uncharacterized protein n=1 Tax=Conoideocrella luteorostrata TaxID=1105319 RepID=A0AAJ0CJS3_9HYPO|nr:hypothetical protein QQS21_008444 [Conoideocrella luteorostrata]
MFSQVNKEQINLQSTQYKASQLPMPAFSEPALVNVSVLVLAKELQPRSSWKVDQPAPYSLEGSTGAARHIDMDHVDGLTSNPGFNTADK